MKKKQLFGVLAFVLTLSIGAQAQDRERNYLFDGQELKTLEPTYLDGVYENSGWGANWFLSVQGGGSTFIGSPTGCGDLTDRIQPALIVGAGKWFTPQVGGRIAYQGFKLKDSQLRSCSYQSVHADFLYNVSSHFRNDKEALPRWDCIPYIGAGILRNAVTHQKPFALSAGVIGRYRVAERWHVTGELGITSTFRDFDGIGASNKFGDNLVQASVGLTVTLGRVGWRRVVDAKPYMEQNEKLIDYTGQLEDDNDRLVRQHNYDQEALDEMRKILEIEGLLGKYQLARGDADEYQRVRNYPKNDYSGLNSLRARIRNKNMGEMEEEAPALATNEGLDSLVTTPAGGDGAVGAPIFFFFRLNTAVLTEKAQMVNLDEIVRVAKKYDIYLRVVGAADSMTGSASGNQVLSSKRAGYISRLLKEKGVKDDHIAVEAQGGINTYQPMNANRHTYVQLYVRK